MPKVSNWGKYGKRYSKSWEDEADLKAWIQPVIGDDSKAMCKFCKCEIRAHHGDLVQHSKSAKHTKNSAVGSSMRLTDFGVNTVKRNTSVQQQELKYACFIACHCSVSTVDHLCELTADMHNRNIRLHRTKCRALICNVIAPCFLDELVQDINNTSYSLIIDESTDIRTARSAIVTLVCLCFVVLIILILFQI